MIGINIKFDLSPWINTLEKARGEMTVAVSRALNRTGDMVPTAVGRELASETGMHVHDVREHMDQERSTPADLTPTIAIHYQVDKIHVLKKFCQTLHCPSKNPQQNRP